MLFGRVDECAVLDRLLDDARRGTSGALTILGEAGVGKTALLQYAAERAQGMTVVQATGVESEAELEFSGLLELVRPLRRDLDRLPSHQADPLRGALGLGEPGARDRFTIGAATLALLAFTAEREALLVVVDDAQWLDAASVDAVRFAARRMAADPVAFLFATRDDPAPFTGAGFGEIRLGGIDADATRLLLAERRGDDVPKRLADRLHAWTGGHPLALIELPEGLAAEITVDGATPEPVPIGTRIASAFAGRLADLPEATRRAVLVAAAAGTNDLEPVVRALALLGLEGAALAPAEDAGVIRVDDTAIDFRHPLLRSVAYHEAPASERRAAHRAVADALAELGDEERRAWHLGASAIGLDADAADALDAVAARAQARGAPAAAAAAYERAGRLTPTPELRLTRLTHGAEAAWAGGDERRAAALADELLAADVVPVLRARALVLRGRIEVQVGTLGQAQEHFEQAAGLLEPDDPDAALAAVGLAVFACHTAGRIADSVALATRGAEIAKRTGKAGRAQGDYLLGRALSLSGRAEEGRPLLEATVAAALGEGSPPWVMLTGAAVASLVLEDEARARDLIGSVLDIARAEGPSSVIFALVLVSEVEARSGRWSEAVTAASEGLQLSHDLQRPNVAAMYDWVLARIAAGRGDGTTWRAHFEAACAHAEAAGMRYSYEQTRCTAGLLALGLDRLDDAVRVLTPTARAAAEMGVCERDLAPEIDLVESLVRLGRSAEAQVWLDAWIDRGVEATVWGRALAARSRGLLAPEDDYEQHFAAALEVHEEWPNPFETARARLAFGERLRRSGRRVEARRELREALAGFEALRSVCWAERARRELRASGQKLRSRGPETGDELTPQELHIALQVAEGKTNREVGAALFLSPKTVEFHLGRVYRKLDVSSRTELARRVARGELAGVA